MLYRRPIPVPNQMAEDFVASCLGRHLFVDQCREQTQRACYRNPKPSRGATRQPVIGDKAVLA